MGVERTAIDTVLHRYAELRNLLDVARSQGAAARQASANDAQREIARVRDAARRSLADSQLKATQEVERAKLRAADRLRQEVTDPINEAVAYLGYLTEPWSSQWPKTQPSQLGRLPGSIRVGAVQAPLAATPVPAMLPLLASKPILWLGDDAGADVASASVRNALARVIATAPPGSYRITLIDAVGLGQNLKEFLRLPAHVRRDKVFADGREIESQLAQLVAHVESVTQNQLLNSASIEAHNRRKGAQRVRYEFVAIVGFPFGFSEAAASSLLRLIENGPRTGTIVLAAANPGAPQWPRAADLATLAAKCWTLRVGSGSMASWNDPDLSGFKVRLDQPPDGALLDRLMDIAGSAADAQAEQTLSFEQFAIPPDQQWKANSTEGLHVPIGVDAAGKVHEFSIGTGMVHHGLIGGLPGSGKTNLLHVLLVQLALAYSPEELEVYLLDFKEGVEFQDYAQGALPHARAIGLESDPEQGLSVLNAIEQELARRGELFRSAQAQTIQAYRAKTGQPMARVLLVLDEYQILFGDGGDVSLTSAATAQLADLIKRGRSFGIHVLLSSQTPASSFTSNRSAMNLVSLRIALKTADADARLILGDNNNGARSLEKSGEAVYNAAGGDAAQNVMVRVAMLEPDERRQRLAEVRQLSAASGRRPGWAPYVFSSSAPARLRQNRELGKALTSGDPHGAGQARLWLGEPIEMGTHVAAVLGRMPRANVLVAGQDERLAHAILASSLIGVCVDSDPNELEIAFVQSSAANQEWSGVFDDLARAVPNACSSVAVAQFGEVLARLSELVAARRSGADAGLSRILVVPGLDRLDALREVDRFGKPAGAAVSFVDVVNDGPAVGVHTFAWAAVFTGVERMVHRPGTDAFGLRVALLMPEAESNAYLQVPAAGRLGPQRALFKDDVRGQRLVKFKPYELPDGDTWTRISERLRSRAGQPGDQPQTAPEQEAT